MLICFKKNVFCRKAKVRLETYSGKSLFSQTETFWFCAGYSIPESLGGQQKLQPLPLPLNYILSQVGKGQIHTKVGLKRLWNQALAPVSSAGMGEMRAGLVACSTRSAGPSQRHATAVWFGIAQRLHPAKELSAAGDFPLGPKSAFFLSWGLCSVLEVSLEQAEQLDRVSLSP